MYQNLINNTRSIVPVIFGTVPGLGALLPTDVDVRRLKLSKVFSTVRTGHTIDLNRNRRGRSALQPFEISFEGDLLQPGAAGADDESAWRREPVTHRNHVRDHA
ncbi:MAG: hypothetical protein HYR55_19390 [Acidobacteria bacterium]|nr:hypothetical protein [Acidobacteriota bacterium]MBI3656824.1 hypothetical protein [Acidobacteriota bacterium]